MHKRICIMGSTGSIGRQTIEVIKEHPEKFQVTSLAVMKSIDELEEQIHILKPKKVVVFDKEKAEILAKRITTKTKILWGMDGLLEIAADDDTDIVLTSVVGSIGLLPTLKAIEAGKDIALANKETLVVAGDLVMKAAAKMGVRIIPVDSEHSAIFQALNGEQTSHLSKIILTASGGPFKDWTKDAIRHATAKDALKHPNWSMGKKISIDSATLMNKGLEVIEARWLFGVDLDKIEVVVHPQSIIHSMIELRDHSIIAQLGVPDMKLPIQYALSYPDRIRGNIPRLDFKEVTSLTFMEPDLERFPCLSLAYEALVAGGTMPCVLNGANEVLVSYYLNGEIGFYDIPKYIEKAMSAHRVLEYKTVEELLEIDQWVRRWIQSQIK
ncbi:1-deoxy-D-xylulose 5-phosphate reductoisomerase [Alkaliphilus metalliredigens QYMF]|uniref:1-deoxy-D-xylulose 5-phosphate reductoisomerase n=1 Tax=Alkaliphilus metalliredigens (strain QYMF) TaxID=293826 RepID=A6TRL6_ALKMQ|nr:1-deoxy-D-xylulose-5-phosphate reductoisomerase [Alkaliphilus metalliredigens]ABR48834.1 1-deoxy-D-xylulose 5-phosphate reductoisomerase [Alkaliphilus metalliredigens QYMF]